MAQKMVDLRRQENLRSVAVQTEENPSCEFLIQLSKNKYIELYRSKSYSDYILTINTNKSKKILITRSMWRIFKKNILQIDGVFMAGRF